MLEVCRSFLGRGPFHQCFLTKRSVIYPEALEYSTRLAARFSRVRANGAGGP